MQKTLILNEIMLDFFALPCDYIDFNQIRNTDLDHY